MKTRKSFDELFSDKIKVIQSDDGNGFCTISTEDISLSFYMGYTFDLLGIEYESCRVGNDPESKKKSFEVQFKYRQEDIKDFWSNADVERRLTEDKDAHLN